jgi:hypothetical protein
MAKKEKNASRAATNTALRCIMKMVRFNREMVMCTRADRGRWRGTIVKSKRDWIDGWVGMSVAVVKKEE